MMGVLLTASLVLTYAFGREYIYRTIDAVWDWQTYNYRFWWWYNSLQEPKRMFVAMGMVSPLYLGLALPTPYCAIAMAVVIPILLRELAHHA